MNKVISTFLLLLALALVICFVGCAGMTVMAVIFHEWGRVLFYGLLCLMSLEFGILSVLKWKEMKTT